MRVKPSPTTLAAAWNVTPQHASMWLAKNDPARLDGLDPAPYITLAERYGCQSLYILTWPQARLDVLQRGAAVQHERGRMESLSAECHKRGFTLGELATATSWSHNALRGMSRRERHYVRVWDAVLGVASNG